MVSRVSTNISSQHKYGKVTILFRCYHEHVDMFTEVRSKTEQLALVETPFGGRHCGKIPPRQRISLYRTMVFIFLSDRDNVTSARFSGTFSFIPDGELRAY